MNISRLSFDIKSIEASLNVVFRHHVVVYANNRFNTKE